MRVRVLVGNLRYGAGTYPFGAEVLVRDADAAQLMLGEAVEPVGRLAARRVSELNLAAQQAERAELVRLEEIHRDRVAVHTENIKRASLHGTF